MNIWGSNLWKQIHLTSFKYPSNPTSYDKNNIKNYIKSIEDKIQCGICRKSFSIYLKHFPIEKFWNNKNGITYFFFYIHNLVNAKLGKELIDFKECVCIYDNIKFTNADQILDFIDYINNIENVYKQIAIDCEKSLDKDPNNPNKKVINIKYKNFSYF